jgi:hypothetical protein
VLSLVVAPFIAELFERRDVEEDLHSSRISSRVAPRRLASRLPFSTSSKRAFDLAIEIVEALG